MTFMVKNKKFIKEMLLISFIGILINLFCLFIYYVPVYASGGESASYFPMGQNDNSLFPDEVISYIDNTYGEDYYVFGKFYNESTSYLRYFIYLVEKNNPDLVSPVFAEIYNNGHQFSLYFIGNYSFTIRRLEFYKSNLTIRNDSTGYTSPYNDLNSSLYDVNCSYISNYRIYTSNNTSNRSVVLNYGSDDDIISHGHATAPDSFDDPVVNSGSNHTLPREVPEAPVINNYSWTIYNPPSIDTSSVLDAIESLGDKIDYNWEYFKDNLHGEFSFIINNINLFFTYIGETIQYYGGLIISNIQNGIETFYNNMVSLFEPIAQVIGYITEPLDTSAVQTALNQTTFHSLVTVGGSFKTTFQNYFDSIPQLDSLSFSIPYSILTKSGYVNIDFSWYSSVRNDIVPWIVGFLYAGFGLAIFRSIPSIIHGVSGVLQKGG